MLTSQVKGETGVLTRPVARLVLRQKCPLSFATRDQIDHSPVEATFRPKLLFFTVKNQNSDRALKLQKNTRFVVTLGLALIFLWMPQHKDEKQFSTPFLAKRGVLTGMI